MKEKIMKNNHLLLIVLGTVLLGGLLTSLVTINKYTTRDDHQRTQIEQLEAELKQLKVNHTETISLHRIEKENNGLLYAENTKLKKDLTLYQNEEQQRNQQDSEYIIYGPYLVKFKTLYTQDNWTKADKNDLIDLFLLLMGDKDNRTGYYDYMDESPDMTIGELIKAGDINTIEYASLFKLVERSDGALSEMTFGYIYEAFIKDAEGLFKANYYGQREYTLLSANLFPYDTEVYATDYQNNMLSLYDVILSKTDLENEFRDYIESEKKEAEQSFAR